MSTLSTRTIRLRNVRQNNLKGWDLDVPTGRLVVVTGLSGAGKSSLVFETLHAEGQRRYVETFSPYTRQFMEMLDRPKVERVENIRPSIAIEQGNTVKTSRSTVGTMTELCDYMKVWFAHRAQLHDPATGEPLLDDTPDAIWRRVASRWTGLEVILTFPMHRPPRLPLAEMCKGLKAQGYTRIMEGAKVVRLESMAGEPGEVEVVQDRMRIEPGESARFLDACRTAFHFGKGAVNLRRNDGTLLEAFREGLVSPVNGRRFRSATPTLFSFNSPVGACPRCRGFGRIIETDYRLVIPDPTLSLAQGAIRAFQGEVYSESQRDLLKACRRHGVPSDVPYASLRPEQKEFVIEGEPGYREGKGGHPSQWYGVRRFFSWLEANTYKMHVRVFLARYRSYIECPDCGGTRLQEESLLWKWQGQTLPDLYRLPVSELLGRMRSEGPAGGGSGLQTSPSRAQEPLHLALEAIVTRLSFLQEVGLGYLTLDRASRTLSGGEVMRVNLTTCLGTALVDTLFVLDEPSVGLHSRDIDRLITILRRLTQLGNTVVVVEHDEAVIRAADHLIEIGPEPGSGGGQLVFSGPAGDLLHPRRRPGKAIRTTQSIAIGDPDQSWTGRYLRGEASVPVPARRRPVSREPGHNRWIRVEGAHSHNLRDLDVRLPMQRLVALSGVSGAGKSTLLDNVLYQGILTGSGIASESCARLRRLEIDGGFSEVVLVDQGPVSRTPRSNVALYASIWDPLRSLLAATDSARESGLTAAAFSFNSGDGRCTACQGLGYERVEMQFMADVYVTCSICQGRRFRPEVLAVHWKGWSVSDILGATVSEACAHFEGQPKIVGPLHQLIEVGLGYLPLGQPLNTLSGGESQRLKLVRYLGRANHAGHALLLLDEPTTGLHRHDVGRLVEVMHRLVESGHSLVVIEHNLDVLKNADWILEMGPEAGEAGGQVVFEGTPEALALAATATSAFLQDALSPTALLPAARGTRRKPGPPPEDSEGAGPSALEVKGAREHNLKDITVRIPHRELTVVTGVSGSGKSSLAFDIVFAEGQRRFLESMSTWARQFVEQLPRAEVDHIHGIPPTVAIEQRVTGGTGRSTVATITEVAQYLRLLYARLGVQHSLHTGEPLVALSPERMLQRLNSVMCEPTKGAADRMLLCAPLVRGRKGHHQPLSTWALEHGLQTLRVDGKWVATAEFRKLDRFREHDIEAVVAVSQEGRSAAGALGGITSSDLARALQLGKGTCFLARRDGSIAAWFSNSRTDPATGEAYPDPDPKNFSWNSAKGWCPTCHGHGRWFDWMRGQEGYEPPPRGTAEGARCPSCLGQRLNPVSRAVKLPLRNGAWLSLPEFLSLTPNQVISSLDQLATDPRGEAILREMRPEIVERLRFMDRVGLDYLSLDRSTDSLSGGEAQRIRLAAQLGSNLSGVLYVLDEPSIGLHAQDNARLIEALQGLRDQGNTLLVVEHDEDTMRHADHIIDLGPGAGIHGGEVLLTGTFEEIRDGAGPDHARSPTAQFLRQGITHPRRGSYRELAAQPKGKGRPRKTPSAPSWLTLRGARLRNLKGFDCSIPIGALTVVAGISGAGKSTLLRDLIAPVASAAALRQMPRITGPEAFRLGLLPDTSGPVFEELCHADRFRRVIEVDQSPIGKTPRSSPATYIGIFDWVRQFFATLPEAKMQGFTAGTFSFNTKGGRCEKCQGAGRVKLEMSFMPDTWVECDACAGQRYGEDLLQIRWKDRNIAQVLAMSFSEALLFFDFHSRLQEMIALMVENGLGYLQLGQISPTLSGGEAQRLKLVSELVRGLPSFREKSRGQIPANLYLLEEPTIGLHLSDVARLIDLLHRLVDQGHTVVVIEHHLDVIAEADHLIEIGPTGGQNGGHLLFQGSVPQLLHFPASPTAPFLRQRLHGPMAPK